MEKKNKYLLIGCIVLVFAPIVIGALVTSARRTLETIGVISALPPTPTQTMTPVPPSRTPTIEPSITPTPSITQTPTVTPTPDRDTLIGACSGNASGLKITVLDKIWRQITIDINGGAFSSGYIADVAQMNQGEHLIPWGEFAKKDGTRFKITETKVQSISITAKPNGQGSYAALVLRETK